MSEATRDVWETHAQSCNISPHTSFCLVYGYRKTHEQAGAGAILDILGCEGQQDISGSTPHFCLASRVTHQNILLQHSPSRIILSIQIPRKSSLKRRSTWISSKTQWVTRTSLARTTIIKQANRASSRAQVEEEEEAFLAGWATSSTTWLAEARKARRTKTILTRASLFPTQIPSLYSPFSMISYQQQQQQQPSLMFVPFQTCRRRRGPAIWIWSREARQRVSRGTGQG